MSQLLSKSPIIMFLCDFAMLCDITPIITSGLNVSHLVGILSVLLALITGLFSLYLKGYYKLNKIELTPWNTYRLFEAAVLTNIPPVMLLFFFVGKADLLKFFLMNIVAVFIYLFISRFVLDYYLFKIKKVKKIIIAGENKRANVVADIINNNSVLKMEIAGITENLQDTDKNSAEIIIFTDKSEYDAADFHNVKKCYMPDFYEAVTEKFYIDEDNIKAFLYEFEQNPETVYGVLKRTFDIISSLIILTVTLPITSYIALRVWLTDKGNPFFTQTRVGKDGKTFECYKLRTMYENDFVPKNGEQLTNNSDRVMPFCKWVRKGKIDEIPQMINILKGEMSIVGPRAEWEQFANVFKNDVPYYSFRNLVTAGWTGWAHVSMPAAYSIDEEKERLAYDLYYIKHRNIFWDISILVKAVFLACGGRHK